MKRPYAVIRKIVIPTGWYKLSEGDVIQKGDLTAYGTGDVWYETSCAGEGVGPGDIYIRAFDPKPGVFTEGVPSETYPDGTYRVWRTA